MDINKIGYGRASVHEFESSDYREYCYMEASLEPWEGVDESLALLRGLVCAKVGIHEDIHKMEERRQALRSELDRLDSRVAEANKKWDKVEEFLKKVGMVKDFDPIPF